MNYGWECPKCGKCYAPFVVECAGCNAQPISGVTTYPSPYQFPTTTIDPYYTTLSVNMRATRTHLTSPDEWPWDNPAGPTSAHCT